MTAKEFRFQLVLAFCVSVAPAITTGNYWLLSFGAAIVMLAVIGRVKAVNTAKRKELS